MSTIRPALQLAAATAVAACLLFAAPAAGQVVEHELGPDAMPAPKQMLRAEPRRLLHAPLAPSTKRQTLSAEATTSSKKRKKPYRIAGRPPRVPHLSTTLTPPASPPYDSGEVLNPTVYPNSTWGKVYARIRGVGPFYCSATVVRARNRSVLFTAGHCVYEPLVRRWADKFVFVPAYAGGTLQPQPFGRWEARKIFSTRQWKRVGNLNLDYAAVVLKRRNGQPIENVTGSLGLSVNSARRQFYRAAGYPAADHTGGGERMWECLSNYKGTDPHYLRPGPKPIGIGCNMTGGTSGGGWSTLSNELASLSSFGYLNRPDRLFGPALGFNAERMRRQAQRPR